MNNDTYLLVTFLQEGWNVLTRCAIKLEDDVEWNAWNEPEINNKLRSLFPPHVQSLGPIVDVQELFHITIQPPKESN